MDFRILGPLEVRNGDHTVALGGDKQRALLAILLLHANETVPAERLIDDLWGARPPPTALKTLQAYISRLRKTLDDHESASSNGALVTRGHGYLLRVEAGQLDVDRFRGLVEDGRQALAAGEPAQAARILRAGLALWRGPPLADLTYETFAQGAIAQLEELRLSALEERVDADLELGRHDQLVGELAALVGQNPLRERLRGQLMLALYRCGRQAEALESYQQFRRGIAEELGLDPGPRLQQLETAILARDPTLERRVTDPSPANGVAAGPSQRTPWRERRGLGLALGGLAVVLVAAVVTALASGGSRAARTSTIAANSVGAISAGGAITAVVPVGSSPSGVAAGAGSVWVANYNDSTVSRIDPVTHAVQQKIQVDSTPIAVGVGSVWVTNTFSGTVSRIDPDVNRVVQKITVGNGPSGVAVGDGSVWVTNSSDGTLSRIDPVSGVVVKTISLGGATDVAAGMGAVWVSEAPDGRVLRIDPQTDQVTEQSMSAPGPARSRWEAARCGSLTVSTGPSRGSTRKQTM